MKKQIMLTICASLISGCAVDDLGTKSRLGAPDHWHAWIEQGGVKYPLPGTVVLKKAGFEIHIVGDDPQYFYGYAATLNKNEIPPLDQMPLIFRVGNGLFVDKPNTKITASDVGVMKRQYSSWNMWAYHPPEDGKHISGFQRRIEKPNGKIEFVRNIDILCTDNGMKDFCDPIGESKIQAMYGVMIGVSSEARTVFFEPAYVNIIFSN